MALLEVVGAAVAWPSAATLEEAAAAGIAPAEVLTRLDFVSVPVYPLLFVGWVLTALWLTFARGNARALRPHFEHRRSVIWAWLGWGVPVVFLWFPFQVVRNIHEATLRWEQRSTAVVGWWWKLWLVYLFSSKFGESIINEVEADAAQVHALGVVETLNAVVAVAAAVLWLRIVKEVTEDQEAAAAQQAPS